MESEYRNAFYEERAQIWKKQEKEINEIVDGLSKKIDGGIKESIVALQLLGFTTTASCEGHLDWGLPGPWIDIGEVPKNILRMFQETRKDPSKLDEQKKALIQETIQKTVNEKARVIELLAEFYQNRKVPFDQMLTLQYKGDSGRLITQGTDVYQAYDKPTRAERLKRYQEEMQAFTEFAKSKFLYDAIH